MLILPVKIREKGEKSSALRSKGEVVGVLYGPKIKNQALKLDYKVFEKIYREAGFSTLISLEIKEKKVPVLIHDIQKDPLTGKFLHIDFYQPSLEEKIEAKIPIVFEGISPAVKDLEGTLIKHIQELEIKALPKNLPKEIRVNVESLKTFEDNILIKDLRLPAEIEILRDPDEIIASVAPPEKIEEELEKPIEEKVEEVEKVEEEKEEAAPEGGEPRPEESEREKEKKGGGEKPRVEG